METSIEQSQPVCEKISDTEIKISREITTTKVETVENTYTKDFLIKQIDAINQQRDAIKATLEDQLADSETKRVAEIAECNDLLDQCEAQGIKTQAEVAAVQEAGAVEEITKP